MQPRQKDRKYSALFSVHRVQTGRTAQQKCPWSSKTCKPTNNSSTRAKRKRWKRRHQESRTSRRERLITRVKQRRRQAEQLDDERRNKEYEGNDVSDRKLGRKRRDGEPRQEMRNGCRQK